MQNLNLINAMYAMNAERPDMLESRPFSPNFRSFNNSQAGYSDQMPTQQYLQNVQAQINSKPMEHRENALPENRPLLDRIVPISNFSPEMQLQSSNIGNLLPRNHPVSEFQEQYNRLQMARMEQQMMTHNEAMMRKHQTFAMRQMINPPTMSRQASAINLHQVTTSTQTTPNAPQAQLFHNNLNPIPNTQSIHQTNGFNNFNKNPEDPYRTHMSAKQTALNLNPFIRDVDMNQTNNDGRCDSGAQSPVHQTLPYRDKEPSSSSSTSSPTKLLKSPKTKRQPTSLVTFSGWLYKQGSEGLRSWRRRWFVLSDYCLFYYKGPEEDKLLGSILLPSYALSECLPSENRAYRKFSFKLEHKNMRTYYLASENGDYMRKWMRVIRAATLMQNLHEIQTRKMLASSTPISTSMITSYDSRAKYNNQMSQQQIDRSYGKVDIHPTLNPFLIFDEDNNERQPLYVNAPPKPRRATNELDYPMSANDPMMYPFSPETSTDSTPMHTILDYEVAALDHGNQNRFVNDNNPFNQRQPDLASSTMPMQKPQQKTMPPRPHSADFLEYESKRHFRRFKDFSLSGAYNERLPYRPKSSLDINSSTDNYYYSEASYAAKMRQSAQYLQNHNKMPNNRAESKLNTLRYENDRKRLTNEFNNYTANCAINDRWGVTLPRAIKSANNNNNNSWKFNSLRHNDGNVDFGSNPGSRYFSEFDVKSPEMYNSSDMLCGDDRMGSQNASNLWSPDISAGVLLSKTHEELVLLLIQLRRQNDNRERALCRRFEEMDAIQVSSINLSAINGNLDRLRTNQIELERRAQLEEERQWNKYNPSQIELHNKVQQLYDLDQRAQEESNNLQILQQDKYEIESTLEELNHKFATNQVSPENYIQSKKIHHTLQLELCKVHSELAEHARRLEMTISENTKLERELLVLRQKWQASRDKNVAMNHRTSYNPQIADSRTVDAYETEMKKVRDSVGEMKRQRDELSMAVSQLTLGSKEPVGPETFSDPTDLYLNKRIESNWTETDIDSMHRKNSKNSAYSFQETEPEPFYYQYQSNVENSSGTQPDDQWNDKQEIKTVRIVKRESERRHREKDTHSLNQKQVNPIQNYSHTYQIDPRFGAMHSNEPSTSKAKPTIRNQRNSKSNNDNTFQSNTAREIFHELANGNNGTARADGQATIPDVGVTATSQSNQFKRITPRKKKRHNTAPNSENFMDYMAERDSYKYNNQRARDDLDMEVVLRANPQSENQISGPPDIVRSALGSKSEYLFD